MSNPPLSLPILTGWPSVSSHCVAAGSGCDHAQDTVAAVAQVGIRLQQPDPIVMVRHCQTSWQYDAAHCHCTLHVCAQLRPLEYADLGEAYSSARAHDACQHAYQGSCSPAGLVNRYAATMNTGHWQIQRPRKSHLLGHWGYHETYRCTGD